MRELRRTKPQYWQREMIELDHVGTSDLKYSGDTLKLGPRKDIELPEKVYD